MYGKEKVKKHSCLGTWLWFVFFRLHCRRDLFTSSSKDALAVSMDERPSPAYSARFLTCSFTCWSKSDCCTHRVWLPIIWQRSILLIKRCFCINVLNSLRWVILDSYESSACCRGSTALGSWPEWWSWVTGGRTCQGIVPRTSQATWLHQQLFIIFYPAKCFLCNCS